MTIASEVRKAGPFNCNGVTDEFSFSFKCFSSADVLVVLTDSDDIETELTIITDYTVALNPDQNTSPGGSITTVATYATGNKITLVGNVDYLQGVDLTNGGAFSADTIENALDKTTMQIQQLNEAVARSVKVDISSTDSPDDFLQNINTSVAAAAASASAASVSETSAANSAASAAASLDSFDDRYLGSKASDPTLDNDGNALLVGALYFNSVNSQMRVYNGSVWSVAFSADKLNKSGDNLLGLLQFDKSTDIVAAATTDLGTATGNAVTVTHASGTVAITSFGGASLQAGTEITITWSVSGGALSVTHNATSLWIPSQTDQEINDGDVWKIQKISDSLANWRVVDVSKADGEALVAPSFAGEIFDWPHASTPSYGLLCNGAAVSRTTYADLFAKISTTWGAGDGSTTFNIPNIPANYTTVQASANEGTSTTGDTKAHTHANTTFTYSSSPGAGSGVTNSSGGSGTFNPTQTMGGVSGGGNAANLPAGVRVRKCIRF